MTAYAPIDAAPVISPWRRALVILAAISAAILLVFARDVADILGIWWNDATFSHCIFIPPIIAWLVWQRRAELAQLSPRTWAPGLALAGAGAFAWLLGDAAGVALFRHAGLIVMLQGAVVTMLGPNVSRGIIFPIAYALFLIPFGKELVPPLQTLTADIAMGLLALTGPIAHIDGIFITTPTGYFEVAEACSGISFLIAMLAYTVLAAHICIKKTPLRVTFVIFGLVVSILANGIRAWGTIYISHLTSIDFAAGFDHIFYGWFFFALVLALVMAAGWRFFDRPIDDPAFDPEPLKDKAHFAPIVPLLLLAVVAAPIAWSTAIAATGCTELPNAIALPEVRGWQRVEPTARHPWSPRFTGADHHLLGRYRNAKGGTVDLAIVLYGHQAEGRELVGFGQGAVPPDSGWAWTATARAPINGVAERITGAGPVTREVVSFYRIDGVTTGSATQVKLRTLKTRLLGGQQTASAVLISAEEADGHSARPAIDAFLKDLGPVDRLVDTLAARAAGR